ncbi:hypothetical protein T08_11232 [Trichinella sp. T8]|uniref:Uncharacterized protein n=1 Tax=Trichinella murrelli TaxID=144512 RepID=A0A0V0TBX0_9BILA|nr:hypothetical protein T05_16078 [Trichinella murrelli]KRZ95647.1 hypothetical protein T08_11232 [Trichinella sp. T8]
MTTCERKVYPNLPNSLCQNFITYKLSIPCADAFSQNYSLLKCFTCDNIIKYGHLEMKKKLKAPMSSHPCG